MMADRNSIVVNIFGGAGAGKTGAAWEIAATLKKLGYVVEYAPEYAKELAWDQNYEALSGSVEGQRAIYEEQVRRVDRLKGKVDFVVTDSPTPLCLAYLNEDGEQAEKFRKEVMREFKAQNNFSFAIHRGRIFETEGRIHTELESKQKDIEIKEFLDKEGVSYGTYTHKRIEQALENLLVVHQGRNKGQNVPDEAKIYLAERRAVRKHEAENPFLKLDNEWHSGRSVAVAWSFDDPLFDIGTCRIVYGVTSWKDAVVPFSLYLYTLEDKVDAYVFNSALPEEIRSDPRLLKKELVLVERQIFNDMEELISTNQEPFPIPAMPTQDARDLMMRKADEPNHPEKAASLKLTEARESQRQERVTLGEEAVDAREASQELEDVCPSLPSVDRGEL